MVVKSIQLSFVSILFSECEHIEISLKNNVLDVRFPTQGIYRKGLLLDQIINGKPSWKSESHAIWYYPDWNEWFIGPYSWLGTKVCFT